MTSESSKGRSSREEEEVDSMRVESVKTSACGLRGFVAGKRVVSQWISHLKLKVMLLS